MRTTYKTLGFATYDEYLKSDHWQAVKKRFDGKGCLVCGDKNICLHHATYKRIGAELDEDLRPLCRAHHLMLHDWIGMKIKRTDSAIRAMQTGLAWHQPPRKAKKKKRRPYNRCSTCNNPAKRGHKQCRPCVRISRRIPIPNWKGIPKKTVAHDPFPGLGMPAKPAEGVMP